METATIPARWMKHGRDSWMTKAARDSLSRMLPRAVADTLNNFVINSAGRSKADQASLFTANYYRTSQSGKRLSTDRWYGGSVWARRKNSVAVASPDLYGTGTGANHTRGLAVDIVPAAIQQWLRGKGKDHGWSWAEGKRNGEAWHYVYDSSRDRFRAEGYLDHAWVQKVVGAEPDGKIGTGTVKLIEAWQAAHGLEADGKVGPGTKAAMRGDVIEDVGEALDDLAYTVEDRPTKNRYVGREKDGEVGELTEIAIHHWGSDGQDFDVVVEWLRGDGNGNDDSSAHEVIEGGRVAVLAPPEDATWSTGQRAGNLRTYALECRPEADETTVCTVAARIKHVREATGKDLPLFPHQHYTDTECPGRYMDLLDTLDRLARGEDVPVAVETTPTGDLADQFPHGKDALMAMAKAPDFPLLRTPGHLCYYGPADGPMESVSGKSPNSDNPGEIYGSGSSSGAHGLKAWQSKMGIEADGRFGKSTEAKARALQKRAGLKQDGKIGPSTFAAPFLLWP